MGLSIYTEVGQAWEAIKLDAKEKKFKIFRKLCETDVCSGGINVGIPKWKLRGYAEQDTCGNWL